jgi:hypothetical protein
MQEFMQYEDLNYQKQAKLIAQYRRAKAQSKKKNTA